MNTNKVAALQFIDYLASLPDGARLEIGEMYDAVNGWRVYIRAGDKAISYDPRGARKWADKFEEMAQRPEWSSQRDWAYDNAKTLRESARVATVKNRDRVVPDGYAEAMPTQGSRT